MIADNIRQQQIEERSEGVYDEIDESAMSKTITSSTVKPSLHNSYLDATYSQCNTMDIKGNPSSLSIAMFSSQSEPARQTNLRRQRHNLEKNINHLNIQSGKGNEYSDGYLRPQFLAKHHLSDKMSENQGTLFSDKEKVTKKENKDRIYDEPAYDGISRSISYDRLIFAQNVGNRDHPLNVQLDRKSTQPRYTTLAPTRKTI
ncbi:unnamed protein product [Mytilus coruscus]|uniref:Uncharacterized protein n=1 Tax=Mytilus coruscus TaxID=42192 RepID=A0A6J8A202_MYTCO|nr:unnamed protein product [Mytilus coruscus]